MTKTDWEMIEEINQEAYMPSEEAKRLLQIQIDHLTSEIIRLNRTLVPMEQEVESMSRRLDVLKHELVSLGE